jgi:hypothetical protein
MSTILRSAVTWSRRGLPGIRFGGADGRGHLGFAATATDFGSDVFNARGH